MSAEGGEVFADTIAFVTAEAIVWIQGVNFPHPTIAQNFGDDAGGSNAEREGVAAYDCGVRHGQAFHRETVNQRVVWGGVEQVDGTRHGQVRGSEDVHVVNLSRGCFGGGPAHCGVGGEGVEKNPTAAWCEFFRIIESVWLKVPGKDDGGGDNGTGEGAASGFIDTGNTKKTASMQGILAAEIAGHRGASGKNQAAAAAARAFSLTVVADLPLRLRR